MKPDEAATAHSSSSGRRALGACATLAIALLLALPLFAWYGQARHGEDGLAAAVTACLVCLTGGLLALLTTAFLQGPLALHGLLASMIFRLGLPLGAGVALSSQGGPLAEAGVFGLIMGYYLLMLSVETPLSVRLIRHTGADAKAS